MHHSLLYFSFYSSGFNDLVDFDLLAPTTGASAASTASWGGELVSCFVVLFYYVFEYCFIWSGQVIIFQVKSV